MMFRIMLCCSAGMSTSLLVRKMVEEAEKRGLPVEINAFGVSEFDIQFPNYQVVLLGPQVKYMLNTLSEKAATRAFPSKPSICWITECNAVTKCWIMLCRSLKRRTKSLFSQRNWRRHFEHGQRAATGAYTQYVRMRAQPRFKMASKIVLRDRFWKVSI